MPATGTFRLRLANSAGTILRVDSRVGTTLAVTVEQDDGNADAGAAVWHGPTAGAMAQLKTDAAAGVGSGGMPWWAALGNPTTPAWTWQNQGGASVVEANGIVFLSVPSATTNWRSRLIAAPATPYTVTILLQNHYTTTTADRQHAGLIFRESGTGKLYSWGQQNSGNIQALKYTNDTTFSAVGAVNSSTALLNNLGQLYWLRFADTGVNLTFSTSSDGRNYTQQGSEGRTVHMAGGPNQIGIAGNCDASAAAFTITFCSWSVT